MQGIVRKKPLMGIASPKPLLAIHPTCKQVGLLAFST
jgi:hypothetical protein